MYKVQHGTNLIKMKNGMYINGKSVFTCSHGVVLTHLQSITITKCAGFTITNGEAISFSTERNLNSATFYCQDNWKWNRREYERVGTSVVLLMTKFFNCCVCIATSCLITLTPIFRNVFQHECLFGRCACKHCESYGLLIGLTSNGQNSSSEISTLFFKSKHFSFCQLTLSSTIFVNFFKHLCKTNWRHRMWFDLFFHIS